MMGGNVFPGLSRISNDTYKVICDDISKLIDEHCYGVTKLIPRKLIKMDHGDIDLVVHIKSGTYLQILSAIGSGDYQVKSISESKIQINVLLNRVSDDFDFQLDINLTGSVTELWYLANYLSYRGLNILVGTQAKKYGFKLNSKGLFKVAKVTIDGKVTATSDYLISDNFYNVLKLLGYNVRAFNDGFNTIKELVTFAENARGWEVKPFIDRSLDGDDFIKEFLANSTVYSNEPDYQPNIDLSDFYQYQRKIYKQYRAKMWLNQRLRFGKFKKIADSFSEYHNFVKLTDKEIGGVIGEVKHILKNNMYGYSINSGRVKVNELIGKELRDLIVSKQYSNK